MATEAEFEESEFEDVLQNQLLSSETRLWSPGRVFEKVLGIDFLVMARNPKFWSFIGYPNSPPGVVLDDYSWQHIWRRRKRIRKLPNYSLNLFIQAKRPSYIQRNSKKYTQIGVGAPHWFFNTKVHQQKALEIVARKTRHKALMMYACPAFTGVDELYRHTDQGSMVENTTFVSIERMTNHKTWRYRRAGTSGWACSEPEYIEGGSFSDVLTQFFNRNTEKNFSENSRGIISLSNDISESLTEVAENGNPIAKEFFFRTNRLPEIHISRSWEDEQFYHYIKILIFCDLFRLRWSILY